ncbi:MAG: (d)CMP kinase [Flavobacteriaceae bacterium]|nr:(d)CMP kinase [Flavobacteriaceae bacterium]
MKKITIAIDGFSSTGKSTLAKALAKQLGYVYVDSGAMYRAVTLYAMRNNWIDATQFNRSELIAHLNQIELLFKFNESKGIADIYLNGEYVEDEIRTLGVSQFVSQVAEVPEVRKKLVEQQQAFGKDKGVIMDGRDIGTVVFPDAELKVFMTASPEIRAQRRFDEMIQKDSSVTMAEVYENVVERDRIDTTREDSPLVMATDAIEVDNSTLSREEQLKLILGLASNKIND